MIPIHRFSKKSEQNITALLKAGKNGKRRGFLMNGASWRVVCVALFWWGLHTPASAATSLSADINADALPALMRQQALGETLLLQHLPLDKDRPAATLQLERFEVFADDAQIVVHGAAGETVLKPPQNVYYRGTVADDPDSQAYVVLYARGGLHGLIRSAGQYWVMEGATAGARTLAAPMLRQIDPLVEFSGRDFHCGSEQLDICALRSARLVGSGNDASARDSSS